MRPVKVIRLRVVVSYCPRRACRGHLGHSWIRHHLGWVRR